MSETNKDDLVVFSLQLPEELRDELKMQAAAAGRSLNAEILARVRGDYRSLRDWFAGQALVAVADDCGTSSEEMAATCYERADAMIAARGPDRIDRIGAAIFTGAFPVDIMKPHPSYQFLGMCAYLVTRLDEIEREATLGGEAASEWWVALQKLRVVAVAAEAAVDRWRKSHGEDGMREALSPLPPLPPVN